jgi:hypothetical protein
MREVETMLRKVLIGTGVVVLLALFFFGRDVFSYIRTSAGSVQEAVKDSVPIEFEIRRAQEMMKNLVPEVRNNMHAIAREEAQVKRLEKQIATAEEELAEDKDKLLRLQSDLADGGDVFRYAGRSYTADQVRTDLANRFERYRTAEDTLTSLRQIHQARMRSLDAAREKLEGTLAAKKQLEVELENLQARVEMIAAARTTSDYNFDDSQLGRVKQLIADLQVRLDVEAKMVDVEKYFHDEIPLDEPESEDIVQRVSQYFGAPTAEHEEVAAVLD